MIKAAQTLRCAAEPKTDKHACAEGHDQGSQHSSANDSRLDRSRMMSDSDDHVMSSPDLRPERYRSTASDNRIRSVDSTLRDLQGMLDDDDTWR